MQNAATEAQNISMAIAALEHYMADHIYGATRGETVSTSAFLACHQC